MSAFIRSVTGLEQSALNEAFASFLQAGYLRDDQITFVNKIITYLSKNGTIDKTMLFEPPFTDLNDQGLRGVFDGSKIVDLVRTIDLINHNAIVA